MIEHQSCSSEGGATAGELPAWTMWPIARSMPAFRQGQPRTNKRKCGIQPANQSLITDVFRSCPHLCTIYRRDPPANMAARGRSTVLAQRTHNDFHVSLAARAWTSAACVNANELRRNLQADGLPGVPFQTLARRR